MLRCATVSDLPQILAIYAPYVAETTHTFEYEAPALSEMEDRFAAITEQFPWLVWEEEGRILGYAYGSLPFERTAFCWSGEVSVYLLPEAQGRGIGRKLYTALEKLMFLQGYRVLYAIVTTENTASLAFHKALGYVKVAELPGSGVKFGRLLGVTWLEKRANIGEIPSNMPESFLSIVKDDRKLSQISDILSLS